MKHLCIVLIVLGCTNYDPDVYIPKSLKSDADSISLSNNRIDSLYFIYNQGYYVLGYDYYKNGKIATIKGTLFGKQYAHNFLFNLKAEIDRYFFILNDNHQSYSIELNDQGTYVEQGTPIVDIMDIIKEKKNDSIKSLNVLFSSFPRKIDKVLLSFNNIDFKEIQLSKYQYIPLLENAIVDAPNEIKYIYFKIYTVDNILNLRGLSEKQEFIDSIAFN